jgi:hypothetical protein
MQMLAVLGIYGLAVVGVPAGFLPVLAIYGLSIINPAFSNIIMSFILPFAGYAYVASLLLGPIPISILAAIVQTMVGNRLGKKRGSWGTTFLGLLLPVNCVLLIVPLGAAGALLGLATYVSGGLSQAPVMMFGGLALSSFSVFSAATGLLASAIATFIGGAYAYNFWAEDKKPGDDGSFKFPGFLSPNHPEVTTEKVMEAGPQAMAY